MRIKSRTFSIAAGFSQRKTKEIQLALAETFWANAHDLRQLYTSGYTSTQLSGQPGQFNP